MKNTTTARRTAILTVAFLVLVVLPLAGDELSVDAVWTEHPAEKVVPPPLPLATIRQVTPLAVLLPAEVVAREQVEAVGRWNAQQRQPMKVGFVRPLDKSYLLFLPSDPAALKSGLPPGVLIEKIGGSEILAARIEVEGAYRLRLRLADVRLPAGTALWVRGGNDDATRFGLELLCEEGDLWTPSVAGSVIDLQISIPAEAGGARPRFRVDSVAQIFPLDANGAAITDPATWNNKGTECLQDAACFNNADLANLDLYKDAVAHLQYIKGGDAYICSGAMINDNDDSGFIPYMLTANHCFSTQRSASTLEAYFDYIADRCGGTVPRLSRLPRVVGANLLATSPDTDSTFIRLAKKPSGTTGYLGWSTDLAPFGTPFYRISHPQGYSQQFSRTSVGYTKPTCTDLPSSRYIYSNVVLGAIAGGSSGSPTVDENLRVRGQLYGLCGYDISNPCDRTNRQVDGRFSRFFDTIEPYLNPDGVVTNCTASGTALCLNNGRFRVEGTWRDFSGDTGTFHAVPFTSDSGLFWFFTASNIEFLVKVLNGCGVDQHYWVLAAATTNVEYSLKVTDTAHGREKRYFNPLGNAAAAIIDTSTFNTCP
ncbi:MAG: trypsin-like peptidase domain-containing protein [bacterium]|nr:trypsin-like peptidase domain-containing protein [bacterium]